MRGYDKRVLKFLILVYLIGFVVLSVFVVPMRGTYGIYSVEKTIEFDTTIKYRPIYFTGNAERIEETELLVYNTKVYNVDKFRFKIQLLAWSILCGGLALITVIPSDKRKSDADSKDDET